MLALILAAAPSTDALITLLETIVIGGLIVGAIIWVLNWAKAPAIVVQFVYLVVAVIVLIVLFNLLRTVL